MHVFLCLCAYNLMMSILRHANIIYYSPWIAFLLHAMRFLYIPISLLVSQQERFERFNQMRTRWIVAEIFFYVFEYNEPQGSFPRICLSTYTSHNQVNTYELARSRWLGSSCSCMHTFLCMRRNLEICPLFANGFIGWSTFTVACLALGF